jgi:hypothetical protein
MQSLITSLKFTGITIFCATAFVIVVTTLISPHYTLKTILMIAQYLQTLLAAINSPLTFSAPAYAA